MRSGLTSASRPCSDPAGSTYGGMPRRTGSRARQGPGRPEPPYSDSSREAGRSSQADSRGGVRTAVALCVLDRLLPVCLSACLSVCPLSVRPSVCLSVCACVCVCVRACVCVCVCVSWIDYCLMPRRLACARVRVCAYVRGRPESSIVWSLWCRANWRVLSRHYHQFARLV
jgi:hypothetical protein